VPCPQPPPPASRAVERARTAVAQIEEAARPSRALAVERRTAARDLLNARLRERDAAIQGSRRPLGGSETFPPCKPLKTKETELEFRQIILPRSEVADALAATVSPNRKESPPRVHPPRRSREIGGPADARRRNFPIRKPLKRLETAKESGCEAPTTSAQNRSPAPPASAIPPPLLPRAAPRRRSRTGAWPVVNTVRRRRAGGRGFPPRRSDRRR
jgi:hypothetical protein